MIVHRHGGDWRSLGSSMIVHRHMRRCLGTEDWEDCMNSLHGH
jgi:hypothetical protein